MTVKDSMNTKISKVVDNKIGDNFTYVAPVNMYGARVGDDVFVGPFCEIQKDVYIGDRVRTTNEETTIAKNKAIAVSLNKVPAIPSIKISGRNTAIKIKVVAIIAKVICLDPL